MILVVVVIAAHLDHPARPGRTGHGRSRSRRSSFAVDGRHGPVFSGRRGWRRSRAVLCLIPFRGLLGGMRLIPLRLHAREPGCEVGEVLAVDPLDVELVAVGGILRHLARVVARQQRLDRPQHVDHLESPVLEPQQVLLLRDRLVLLPLHLFERGDGRPRLVLHAIGLREGSRIQIGRVGGPSEEHSGEADRRRREQPCGGADGPRLLRLDQPIDDDLARQQVRANGRAAGGLQREAIGGSKREPVFAEGRRRRHGGAFETAI